MDIVMQPSPTPNIVVKRKAEKKKDRFSVPPCPKLVFYCEDQFVIKQGGFLFFRANKG